MAVHLVGQTKLVWAFGQGCLAQNSQLLKYPHFIDSPKGEQMAQACANAWLRQLHFEGHPYWFYSVVSSPVDGARSMTRQKESLSRRLRKAALVVVLLPLALISLTLYVAHRIALYMLVWVLWLPRGKDILVVYSDSPIWHEYMATQVLPLVQERAIVLNWSERNRWPRFSFAPHVFHCFGGNREFNPLVVLFQPFHRARTFRFWLPFKDWKAVIGSLWKGFAKTHSPLSDVGPAPPANVGEISPLHQLLVRPEF
jgi:hypothetical protein